MALWTSLATSGEVEQYLGISSKTFKVVSNVFKDPFMT